MLTAHARNGAALLQAAVEVSQSLALACPLHPDVDDVSPLCSWLVGAKGESPSPEVSPLAQESAVEKQPLSLSVQLFTTSLQGQLRCGAASHLLTNLPPSPDRALILERGWARLRWWCDISH